MSDKTLNQIAFLQLLKLRGLPDPQTEHRFHSKRRWRFDYAWPDQRIALEVEGGVWKRGRHNHPSGFLKDMEKYNTATILGWRLIRVTPQELATDKTCDMVEMLMKLRSTQA